MAPTIEGQVEVRGLLLGPGTNYPLVEFNPWVRNVRADQGGPRAWSHGTWSGAEWADQVVVPLRVHTEGGTTAEWSARHQALRSAFQPVGDNATDVELRFLRGGVEYVMFGRPRMVEPETRPGALRTFDRCAFVATDPITYSGVEQVAVFGLPEFTGGLTIPLTVPFTVDGVLIAGFADLINTGTAETPLLLRIDGPVSEPRFTVRHPDGQVDTLRILLDLGVGQWVTIDTGSHTVLLQDVANRRAQVVGTFPRLRPGTSLLRFFAADFNDTAQLTANWRHAWW